MKEVYARIVAYFDEKVALCKEQERTCAADGRGDESVFAKIRGNVYDIFRTVFSVAVRLHGEDGKGVAGFFGEKLTQIPAGWQTEQDKATQHGDTEKAYIEELKLQTAATIRADVEQLWEVCI